MANTADLLRQLPERNKDITYRALYLNPRGLRQALNSEKVFVEGNFAISASDQFSVKNTNKDVEQTLSTLPEWIRLYNENDIDLTNLTVMAAYGCNFEGPIALDKVLSVIDRVNNCLNAYGQRIERLLLADTMAWANPMQVRQMIAKIRKYWSHIKIRMHLHDTRGLGLPNALAALELGVDEFECSVGGLGGCPFAANVGAAGNVCTEDLVFMCEQMGINTGVRIDKLIEASRLAAKLVGHDLPGKIMKSGTPRQSLFSETLS